MDVDSYNSQRLQTSTNAIAIPKSSSVFLPLSLCQRFQLRHVNWSYNDYSETVNAWLAGQVLFFNKMSSINKFSKFYKMSCCSIKCQECHQVLL